MSEPVETFPAPSLEEPPPANKWEREYRAFLALLPELLKTHRGQYVAIHEGRVEDTDPNELALVERVLGRLGDVSIHVGLVAESEPVYRIPHYRTPHRKQG
jgi:Tfp pilus assembly protein PilP